MPFPVYISKLPSIFELPCFIQAGSTSIRRAIQPPDDKQLLQNSGRWMYLYMHVPLSLAISEAIVLRSLTEFSVLFADEIAFLHVGLIIFLGIYPRDTESYQLVHFLFTDCCWRELQNNVGYYFQGSSSSVAPHALKNRLE